MQIDNLWNANIFYANCNTSIKSNHKGRQHCWLISLLTLLGVSFKIKMSKYLKVWLMKLKTNTDNLFLEQKKIEHFLRLFWAGIHHNGQNWSIPIFGNTLIDTLDQSHIKIESIPLIGSIFIQHWWLGSGVSTQENCIICTKVMRSQAVIKDKCLLWVAICENDHCVWVYIVYVFHFTTNIFLYGGHLDLFLEQIKTITGKKWHWHIVSVQQICWPILRIIIHWSMKNLFQLLPIKDWALQPSNSSWNI